jgi:class 3 adenylate cyclase
MALSLFGLARTFAIVPAKCGRSLSCARHRVKWGHMPGDPERWLATARTHAQAGDQLLAYDVCVQGLEENPKDPALKHAAVLALARSGATAQARRRYRELGLDAVAPSAVPRALYIDIAALDARITKDLALAASAGEKDLLLTEAAAQYRQIFGNTGDYYPGINAATLLRLAGRTGEAKELAASVRAICEERVAKGLEGGYYLWATLAEALLNLGEDAAAANALAHARRTVDCRPDAIATTRRQLRLLCAATHASELLLDSLPAPIVVYYAGHRLGARLSEAQMLRLSGSIDAILAQREVLVGFGSLAVGADILIAEALLARGAALELVFPFRLEEFRDLSVRPAGEAWLARFDQCLARARATTFATDDLYLGDDHLFNYASRLAMGLSLQRSWSLDSEARLLAIWNGGDTDATLRVAGTTVAIGLWHSLGRPADVLTPDGKPIAAALAPAPRPVDTEMSVERVLRAMLFGDVKGFSQLSESQLATFADKVLGLMARTLERYGAAIHHANTWGDGLYVVVDDAETAADCALELQRTIADMPFSSLGLPPLGLRLGAHFGPVFPVMDPVIRRMAFMGCHVSRTARIEPVTPEGMVYVTDAFAAALATARNPRFICNYMGIVPAAKNYGSMRMFALHGRKPNDRE